jgi:RTA1 like protein
MNSFLAALPVLVSRDNVTTNSTRFNYRFCTTPSDLCPVESSYYYYRVDLGANAAFAALFGISLIGFLGAFIMTRRAFGFSFAMMCGVILEIIGYAGRLMSWKNQWDENGFLIQIVCLTIAPAFMAAGIYLCLRRIVYAFGPENSRIRPETYTRLVSSPSFRKFD